MPLQKQTNNYFNSMDEFELCTDPKPLGTGSFGIVRKALHKLTNKYYAIKIVELMDEMSQTERMLLERQISIHFQLDHPHIVRLWSVLRDHNKLYMVMDYIKNGNLFNHERTIKSFSESQSFHIFYQVLEGVGYMHQRNVFHRDIKPENILLDHEFNVKLCDFGWVAEDIHRKRTTFCGTYEYMAPEMLNGKPYDYRIDIWALGILLYQLTHGKAPFEAKSVEKIKEKLQTGLYEIKESISKELKNLIISILQFQPEKRASIVTIKESQWVKKNKLKIENLSKSTKYLKRKKQTQFRNDWSLKRHSIKKEKKNFQKNHKKYKTLEEEDFVQLMYPQNTTPTNTKQSTHHHNNSTSNILKEISPKLMIEAQNIIQPKKNKPSIPSSRSHTRTQSSEIVGLKRHGLQIVPEKMKISEKDLLRKKKNMSKKL